LADEEEQLVLLDRPAEGAAELIALEKSGVVAKKFNAFKSPLRKNSNRSP